MTATITALLQQIEDKDAPVRLSAAVVQFAQDEKFFHLAAAKASRTAQLRRQVGMVLQENLLFHRSVRENIAIADPAA